LAVENHILRRIISGLIAGAISVCIIYFAPDWFFSVVVAAIVGVSLHEFFRMVRRKGIFVYRYYGIIFGIVISIATYFRLGFGIPDVEPFFIVIISLFIFVLQFLRKDNSGALAGISITLLGILYIGWFFSYIIKLKILPNGENLVMALILITKFSDIGAYVMGTIYGKHTLVPNISPKKSKEGLIGGILCSFVVALLCSEMVGFSVIHMGLIGAFIGVLAQVGDLSESLIKRDCQVKDSGKGFPGIGGMLDLIDSLLFTAPMFYYYIRILSS
jgi:phosphatidate cytidylyltransferase